MIECCLGYLGHRDVQDKSAQPAQSLSGTRETLEVNPPVSHHPHSSPRDARSPQPGPEFRVVTYLQSLLRRKVGIFPANSQ